MIPDALLQITQELPYRLRDEIESYVNAVDAAVPEIVGDRRAELTKELRDKFLFLVGVRRLWSTVDGTLWLASNTSSILQRAQVGFISAGSTRLGPGSDFAAELRKLRSDLQDILYNNNVLEAVLMSHLSDVMAWVLATSK